MENTKDIKDKKVEGKKRGGRRNRKDQNEQSPREVKEFDQKILDLARVTRVMAGGKRMSFRACVALGNKKGKIGIGLAKGADVTIAINKAVAQAQKNMLVVTTIKNTIPHQINIKNGSAHIFLKPASLGSGIKAGGVVRVMLELAGISDVSAKIIGNGNKINNAKTLLKALSNFKLTPKMKQIIEQEKTLMFANNPTVSGTNKRKK